MKDLKKNSVSLIKTGVVLGVGSSLTSSNSSLALNNLSKGLPVAGSIIGSGVVLKELKKIKR